MINWLQKNRIASALLTLSLGLNVFLLSMNVGKTISQASHDSQTRRSIQAMLEPLPPASQEIVRKEIGTVMPKVKEHFAALRNARKKLGDDMANASIGTAALELRFSEVQAHTTAIGFELQKAIARALPKLNAEDRRAIVAALAKQSNRGALPLP
jgi:uncharacterized membrane protein